MIRPEQTSQPPEPAAGRPEASGEQWLGRNSSSKRRLWERLNPRHRKTLRLLAHALALRQSQARLPEDVRARLLAALEDLASPPASKSCSWWRPGHRRPPEACWAKQPLPYSQP